MRTTIPTSRLLSPPATGFLTGAGATLEVGIGVGSTEGLAFAERVGAANWLITPVSTFFPTVTVGLNCPFAGKSTLDHVALTLPSSTLDGAGVIVIKPAW